jgi:peptidyl-prolyl cis-trans isomerase SurA
MSNPDFRRRMSPSIRAGGLAAALACLALAGLWHGPASAQTSIVALVNNSAITSTEVSERRALIRLTQKKNLDSQQALDQLIDNMLLAQEAQRRQITIPDADVDQRFAGIGESTKLGVDKLGQVLAQGGTSTRAFKAEIRSGLLQRKMMGMLARTATGISEKEIAAGITAKKTEGEGTSFRYTMQQVVFVSAKGSTPAQLNQRKTEAEGLRRRAQDCTQAAGVAKELRDVAVKPPIIRLSAQLPVAFREQLAALKVGQSTKPEASELGVEVIFICDKQQTTDDSALRTEVQNQLVMETGKDEVQKFLADLRKRALIIYK